MNSQNCFLYLFYYWIKRCVFFFYSRGICIHKGVAPFFQTAKHSASLACPLCPLRAFIFCSKVPLLVSVFAFTTLSLSLFWPRAWLLSHSGLTDKGKPLALGRLLHSFACAAHSAHSLRSAPLHGFAYLLRSLPIWDKCILFGSVDATLWPALSVGRSVSQSVGRSVISCHYIQNILCLLYKISGICHLIDMTEIKAGGFKGINWN